MAIDTELFKRVMGHFLTGVTVVTTRSQEQIAGITVSSFCSLSLDPPLVLVCIDLSSNTLPLLRESKIFAVNILSAQQEHLSRGFATNTPERFEHFCHAPYHTATTGAPILDDTQAFIDARIVAEYPGGDHAILIGAVEDLGANNSLAQAAQNGHLPTEEPHPLAYYQGQYRHLASNYHKPSLSEETYDNKLERRLG
ncbi:MAG: flavin reductase family protein [Ktedonobacteraceae bacterium]|jgi:flavin reductase (DIM6/NTAB) family NADH-FMN oxidoreductase RutF|nr:flavin reductase family protein [Ktedonobacteraceae bacterium]